MFRRYTVVLGVLCLVFSGVRSALAVVQYTVTDLGTLPHYETSRAYAINASGQVVGNAHNSLGDRAFLYSNGAMTDLGTLGVAPVSSDASGINASGQVVGTSGGYAFLYSNGTMTDLGTLGGSWCEPYAINDSGQVVGRYMRADPHAFLYSNGTTTDLGAMLGNIFGVTNGQSYATGINESGQVVGTANYAAGIGFLYSGGVMTCLRGPGGASCGVQGINAGGDIVGATVFNNGGGGNHAALYSHGTWTDLGTLGDTSLVSCAFGINSSGQVVGCSQIDSGDDHAFLYSNGTMIDLNSLVSGWTLEQATAINDSGQIVGYGLSPSGYTDAFLLTPVPEPSTLVLLSVSAIGLLVFARRRRKWAV